MSSLCEFRPRTIYVPVSTALLSELSEWSKPLHVRIEQDLNDDTFEMAFKVPEPDAASAFWKRAARLLRDQGRFAAKSNAEIAGQRLDRIRELERQLEDVRGDIYLWRIGELDAETAMCGVRDTLEPTVARRG